jgi:hypothetical protein
MDRIFDDRTIPGGIISNKSVKQSRTEALRDLAVNDKFLYKPPIYRLDSSGKPEIDPETSRPIMEKKPCDPFHGPYIRNTIRFLLFERQSEFPEVPKTVTIPLVAFVCTLVCIKYSLVCIRY